MLLDTAIMGKECENSTSSSTIKDGNQSTPIRKPRRANTKRTGELSEAAFLLKAKTLGFGVSRPWGDSERYDFVLDSGQRLWRAQIKCTLRARPRIRYPAHPH
jgi:hypothetical protein